MQPLKEIDIIHNATVLKARIQAEAQCIKALQAKGDLPQDDDEAWSIFTKLYADDFAFWFDGRARLMRARLQALTDEQALKIKEILNIHS